jgi:DNA-3-methyladenine glycosylase II
VTGTAEGAAYTSDIEARLTESDPALGRAISAVIARVGAQRIMPSRTAPFEALVRAIAYQSVSGRSAAAIFARLKDSVGEVSPAKVRAVTQDSLTAAGLSKSKSATVYCLADWFDANQKIAGALPELPDDDVISALTGIPGIGAWTVNVFLIFNLGRLDVMPVGDLGIRRGVQLVYGLETIATPKQVQTKAQLWRPYRSIASIYLWQAVKVKISREVLAER